MLTLRCRSTFSYQVFLRMLAMILVFLGGENSGVPRGTGDALGHKELE